MTFCLGVTVEEGLVGIADTRVVSGFESLTARKVATYQLQIVLSIVLVVERKILLSMNISFIVYRANPLTDLLRQCEIINS